MWKDTADIAIRTVLVLSVACFGATPATASVFSIAKRTGLADDRGALANLPEIARIILAQSVDHQHQSNNDGGGSHDRSNGSHREGRELPLTRPMTYKIVLDLASIRHECGSYDEIYRIDCLRQGIDMIVASLPDNSEYRNAKRILGTASRRLSRIVSTYQDPTAPKLEVPADANPRFPKRRRYTAIRPNAVPEPMAKAQSAVEEAATALLRSSENSARRYAHYQEISVAVDSTKVLLRSS